jgi:pyruvate kinase
MDAKELNKRQQEIWKEMEKLAKELENGNRLPIYDGVCDLDG